MTDSVPLAKSGPGFVRFRSDGVHWGTVRLVRTITHAAHAVGEGHAKTPPLVVGDLSEKYGGKSPRHRSHRTGRDVDLLFYALTPDGRPIQSPGFVRFGPDGLGKPDGGTRWIRFDTARQWSLVKALVEAPEAHVQWIFVARWLEALIAEHALARGEDPELVWHAQVVMKQPGDSAPHDDHFHVRLACTPDEAVAGCAGGPRRPWHPPQPKLREERAVWVAALLGDPSAGLAIADDPSPARVERDGSARSAP